MWHMDTYDCLLKAIEGFLRMLLSDSADSNVTTDRTAPKHLDIPADIFVHWEACLSEVLFLLNVSINAAVSSSRAHPLVLHDLLLLPGCHVHGVHVCLADDYQSIHTHLQRQGGPSR